MSIRRRILNTIRYMAVVFGLICVCCVCTLKADAADAVTDGSVIPEGVYINEEHVGGMTIGEAKTLLATKEAEISRSVFTLTYGEHKLEIPFVDLGLKFQSATDVLYDAATVGQTGSLIDRYKELKDLEKEQVLCTWSYSIDQELLEEKTASFAEVIYVEPVDATIDRQNDQWFREPHVDGLEMDNEATLELVRAAVSEWNGQSVSVEAVANVVSPKYTTELLSTITEIIGNAGTGMGGDVESGRGKNVVRGAELIHGTILLPGESFSAHEKLTPFELSNGYDYAVAYFNGGYARSIGGGVCQLTTTLYNAVMQAELQVDRRYNHSMIISYAPYGFDSTVNDDGSKDLVFTNPYDFPIYIEAKAWRETEDLGLVYMAIWGTLTDEIREREVELYYEEIEREEAETIYTIDPNLEPGKEVVDQSSYPKLVVKAYKRVTVNGEVISDEYLYTDYYRRSDGKVRHNPIEETTGESEESSSDVTEGSENADTTTGGSESTESTAGEVAGTESTTESAEDTENTTEGAAGTESTTEGTTSTENTTEGTMSTENTTEGTEDIGNTNEESNSVAEVSSSSAADENEGESNGEALVESENSESEVFE